MRRLSIAAAALAAFVGLIVVPTSPALADTTEIVTSASTTESQDCHDPAHTTNTYNTRYMFDGDVITVNYSNCNSNYSYGYGLSYPSYSWNYGNVYVNVGYSASGGPTGTSAPSSGANYSVPDQDRQCIKVNSSDPGDWSGVSYGLPQMTATMTAASPENVGVFVYDQGPGCGGSAGWNFKQIVYALKPVTPTISAAFASPYVAPGSPVDLVITLDNTQIYRAGNYGSFTGIAYTLGLPGGATAGAASANTCRGASVSGGSSVSLSSGALGGSGYETEGSCSVTVPVTFPSTGNQTLNNASVTASDSSRGDLLTNVNATIGVTDNPPSLSPANASLTGEVGKPVSPTTPFTPNGLTEPITYSVSPDLPAGLVLDPLTGVISGTPQAEQQALVYTITASDGSLSATANVTITVNAAAGLPDTGTSIRIGLGVTITGLTLWGLAWVAFSGRRRLGLWATDVQVRDLLAMINKRLGGMEKPRKRKFPF